MYGEGVAGINNSSLRISMCCVVTWALMAWQSADARRHGRRGIMAYGGYGLSP